MAATPVRHLRVSDDAWDRWKQAAKDQGVSVAALIHEQMKLLGCRIDTLADGEEMATLPARKTRTLKLKPKVAGASCPPHPKGARTVINAGLGLYNCGACGDNYRS